MVCKFLRTMAHILGPITPMHMISLMECLPHDNVLNLGNIKLVVINIRVLQI